LSWSWATSPGNAAAAASQQQQKTLFIRLVS
jgi:hypothetical protein